MTAHGLTLKKVQESSKLKSGGVFHASDFLSEDEKREIAVSRAIKTKPKRRYNAVDAFVAEMTARFGYEFYKEWAEGKIPTEKVNRLIAAERARERSNFLGLEAIVITAVSSCVRREKGQPKPKGMKIAQDIFRSEEKKAKGEL